MELFLGLMGLSVIVIFYVIGFYLPKKKKEKQDGEKEIKEMVTIDFLQNSVRTLKDKNKSLMEQNDIFSNDLSELASLKDENRILKLTTINPCPTSSLEQEILNLRIAVDSLKRNYFLDAGLKQRNSFLEEVYRRFSNDGITADKMVSLAEKLQLEGEQNVRTILATQFEQLEPLLKSIEQKHKVIKDE